MKLQINDQVFNVDMSPMRQRAASGMQNLIADRTNPLIRQAVKAAAMLAMDKMGIKKADRNDDPITLVAFHIANLIFDGIEKEGVLLSGERIGTDLDSLQGEPAAGLSGEKALPPDQPQNVPAEQPADASAAKPAQAAENAETDGLKGGETDGGTD